MGQVDGSSTFLLSGAGGYYSGPEVRLWEITDGPNHLLMCIAHSRHAQNIGFATHTPIP
jgi:hypothetical protein